MEPGKTSFFQALGVPTKIARGTIEITTDLKLVEAGAKVGASEATLLNMLNISPFTYGMKVTQVYEDGQAFSPDVLDIEESQLLKALTSAIATITTISLATNYPTLPSVLHSLINGYKQVLAVAVETDYSWEGIEELKDRIANPDAYAAAAPPRLLRQRMHLLLLSLLRKKRKRRRKRVRTKVLLTCTRCSAF